ncbi:methylesterase 10-like [Cornus florida]|uniref:methylesterase 10-like n=1 Tax=Cornus florida TaxID=4283 RepID=UPI0028A0D946|nr:methylesterase 10-like [Cornus florida]
MEKIGKHFVLVHGICHGAWSWYKLVNLLKSAGHRVTALDLAASGVDPKPIHEIASISDYIRPLMDFMASLPHDEGVVIVGHSYGGLAISLAMESFPEKISLAVFITAYMPNLDGPPSSIMQEFFRRTSPESLMDSRLTFDQGPEGPPTSVIFGPDYMATKAYKHCQLEDLELAKMLVRPGGLFMGDMAKESLLTKEKYGSIARVYIVCEEDEVMVKEYQLWLIQNYKPKEVKSIAGADHMVMLSKPTQLCNCLQDISERYS